jgi:SAM-dependent methyltransferase
LGINAPCAARLARARKAGVIFRDTLTIGRMGLAVPETELAAIARTLGLDPAVCRGLARDRFADRFFRIVLGAENLRSIDFSHYQDADILHDLNSPVPAELQESCDVLYDGGAMEHVFDVRQVLTNYMTMVRPGGRIFINVPANNLFGHGFYQFSTEFFYRVFEAANGFAVRDMLVIESPFASVEASGDWRCFRTLDPAEAGTRIRLVSSKPQMIFVEAERIERVVPFAQPPMQSDYRTRWDREPEPAPPEESAGEPFAYLTLWQSLKRTLKQRRKQSLRNRRFFTRTDPL